MVDPTSSPKADFRAAAREAIQDIEKEHVERLQDQRERESGKEKRRKRWSAFRWGLLIVCVCVLLVRMPAVISSVNHEEKPLRIGTFDTDAVADQCIRDLWKLSQDLQNGKLPDAAMLCPASKKPYAVVRTEGDIIVRTPHPERYGFREIRVSRRKPVPEIVK